MNAPAVRWGVLGGANIAVRRVIPAIQASAHGTVTALASRDPVRVRETAAQLGVGVVCASYEELLERSDVDAVYVPLPNHLHVPWSIRALEAGRHVLCEKPIAMNATEAAMLAAEAAAHPRLKVMEAFMYRFHPQWVRARELVQERALGTVRAVETHFSYFNVDPANTRNIAAVGGGALMDIGSYAISLSRFLYGAEPARVLAHLEYDPRFGTDRLTNAILDFGGRSATFTCGTQMAHFQRVHILGTDGRIEIEYPFNAPDDRPRRIHIQRGAHAEDVVFDVCDQYTIMADAFADAVLRDSAVPTPIDDAVANMRVIDAVVQSAATGAWVRPAPEA